MKKEEEISRNIYLLGGSSFFNDIGSEMITPIIPFYITALGGTGIAVGLISGLREGLASLLKVFGGWFSDKIGKRMPFVFFGYIFSVIFRLLLGFANSWQYILSFLSFERFGKLRDAPRDALISQSAKKAGSVFGLHQAMDTAGGIIGTLIVIFLFWKLQLSIKSVIFIAAGISALSLVPLFFVKEHKTKRTKAGIFLEIKKLNPKLKYFIFVSSVFALANFGLYMFMILKAKEITGSIVMPLVLYAVFGFVYAVFSVPFGNLSDRIGRKKLILAGYLLFLAVGMSFLFFNSLVSLVILFVLYGLVFALTQGNQRAFVSDLSDKNRKGTSYGLFGTITGIVNILGGFIAGILWDVNHNVMFAYLSAVAFVSVLLLMFVKERK